MAVKPGVSVGHHEAADPVVRPLGPDDRDVGERAVGDPHLAAVEHPVVAVAPGPGAHRRRVAAGVGLGQAEAADRLAGGHPRQPLLLVLLAAPAVDRVHRQRALHGHEAAQPGVDGLELAAGDAVRRRRSSRRSRSPRGACRAARARRALGPRSSGSVPASYQSATCGASSASAKARTVSRMSRSSVLSSASTSRKSWGSIAMRPGYGRGASLTRRGRTRSLHWLPSGSRSVHPRPRTPGLRVPAPMSPRPRPPARGSGRRPRRSR